MTEHFGQLLSQPPSGGVVPDGPRYAGTPDGQRALADAVAALRERHVEFAHAAHHDLLQVCAVFVLAQNNAQVWISAGSGPMAARSCFQPGSTHRLCPRTCTASRTAGHGYVEQKAIGSAEAIGQLSRCVLDEAGSSVSFAASPSCSAMRPLAEGQPSGFAAVSLHHVAPFLLTARLISFVLQHAKRLQSNAADQERQLAQLQQQAARLTEAAAVQEQQLQRCVSRLSTLSFAALLSGMLQSSYSCFATRGLDTAQCVPSNMESWCCHGRGIPSVCSVQHTPLPGHLTAKRGAHLVSYALLQSDGPA